MSLPPRTRGVKVLKAVSSPLRLQILNLLYDKSALSYTELMNQLKMNPSRDAGRFAYHLKFLLKANLVEVDSEAKKYYLTDLGKMVIDVADRVEKKAVKTKGMLVRTSHFTFEEFDANKIANNLIKEAKMPAELAQKTAKETEKFLLKSKIKYLTAPLIREIVNASLIEKGFEDYRHKLTRLGLPVHEVTSLIEAKDGFCESALLNAGKAVFREFTLLNVFPRDIADAHVSGALHINGLSTWILKPSEVMHDLRFFLQNGLQRTNYHNSVEHFDKPPHNIETALALAFNALLLSSKEVNETQTMSYFNVFLAPFAKGVELTRVKEALRLFILGLNQHVDVALSIEPNVPAFLAGKPAIGLSGKASGSYADFAEEAKALASLIISICGEESCIKPMLNPKLIVNVSAETLTDESSLKILQKAHELAADKATVYFANPLQRGQKTATFSSSGAKLESDVNGDWETDTLRTGCLGCITINMHRIVHESEADKAKFIGLLKERCELAVRGLAIKYQALKMYGHISSPFLMQGNGDAYFRLENCSGVVNFAGFYEAIEAFTGKPVSSPESIRFAEEIAQNSYSFINKASKRHIKRMFQAIVPNPEASARLAQLDVERYGVAKVKFSGTRERPFYPTARRIVLSNGNLPIPCELFGASPKLRSLNAGGSLAVIELNSSESNSQNLTKLTVSLMEKHKVEFLTYNHVVTHCGNCQKSWFGNLRKCPSCGSMGLLMVFNRFEAT